PAGRSRHPVPDHSGLPRGAGQQSAQGHGFVTINSHLSRTGRGACLGPLTSVHGEGVPENMSHSTSQGGQPPLTPRRGKVTVVGAGFYGSTTAQRLAEYDIFDEVVLTDIIEGKPEGLALDMNQSRPVEGFETKVTGQTTGPGGE